MTSETGVVRDTQAEVNLGTILWEEDVTGGLRGTYMEYPPNEKEFEGPPWEFL